MFGVGLAHAVNVDTDPASARESKTMGDAYVRAMNISLLRLDPGVHGCHMHMQASI